MVGKRGYIPDSVKEIVACFSRRDNFLRDVMWEGEGKNTPAGITWIYIRNIYSHDRILWSLIEMLS